MHVIAILHMLYFWTQDWSQIATTVVLVLLVTTFRKMPKAFLIRIVRKLRIHIRDHILDRSTVSDF